MGILTKFIPVLTAVWQACFFGTILDDRFREEYCKATSACLFPKGQACRTAEYGSSGVTAGRDG